MIVQLYFFEIKKARMDGLSFGPYLFDMESNFDENEQNDSACSYFDSRSGFLEKVIQDI